MNSRPGKKEQQRDKTGNLDERPVLAQSIDQITDKGKKAAALDSAKRPEINRAECQGRKNKNKQIQEVRSLLHSSYNKDKVEGRKQLPPFQNALKAEGKRKRQIPKYKP